MALNFNSSKYHPISKVTKKSLSSFDFSIRKIEGKWQTWAFYLKSLFKKDFFALPLIIILSLTFIANKGLAGYHGSEIKENKIEKYIDIKKFSALFLNRAQSAEANTASFFVGLDNHNSGDHSINTVQQTALLAFNSLENDLSSLKDNDYQSNQITTYDIQEGDTLSFIASDFGVSVETIIWANNLNNINAIKPGNELKIPPVDGIIHKVKKGDSIQSIAKKYGANEEKIIAFNALPKDGSIQIDAELMVPEGKIIAPKTSNAMTKYNSTIKRFTYLPDLGGFFMVPTTGRNWGRIHGRNGIDIANSCGTPIFASADGSIATADAVGWNGGYGKFIKITHTNGTETIYAHASKLLVGTGESVQKGQQIGVMGTTGRSTGCHLHFEVHGAKNPLAKY